MYSVFYFSKQISKNVKDVLTFAFFSLIFAHFLLREYMPSPIVGAIGAGILFLLFYYTLCHKRDALGFLLLIFVCTHFSYADNQGGLWNLLSCGLIGIYWLTGAVQKRVGKTDLLINFLILALLLSNFLGWMIRNEMPTVPLVQGILSFVGMLLCYILMSRIVITPANLKTILYVQGVMMGLMFLVALNQRFAFLNLNTPLLGSYSATANFSSGLSTYRAGSTFQHYELFGEYAMMMMALFIPLIVSRMTQSFLKIKPQYLLAIMIFSLLNVLLSGTRSAFLLVVFTGMFYLGFFLFFKPAIVDARQKYLRYILLSLVLLSLVGSYVGLDSTLNRFEEITGGGIITAEKITSGEAINRGPLFVMGMQRINSDNWFVGYGSGVPISNYVALFNGRKSVYSDFHNLYLSLPILYGWIGAFAYVGIVLVLLFRLIKTVFVYKNVRHYLMPVIIGLIFFWVLLLVDQFKISLLRMMNYQMLIWLYLGFTAAVLRTFYYYKPQANTAGNKKLPKSRDLVV